MNHVERRNKAESISIKSESTSNMSIRPDDVQKDEITDDRRHTQDQHA